MKKNFWAFTVLAALVATTASVQAQGTGGAGPGSASSSAAEAPAKLAKRKATSIKARVDLSATAVAKGENVNVRGQPSFVGEVLGHLQKGTTVTILEDITLNHPPTGEPGEWYKIVMPPNIPVWVDAEYVDAGTKSIKARRINLRGGPGENYSVVGRLEKGAIIDTQKEEKGWIAITAPSNAYAFIAAELVEIQAPAASVAQAPAPAAPAPETVVVNNPAAPVAAATEPAPAPAPVAPAPTAQSETEQELAALRKATTEPASAPVAAPTPGPAPTPAAEEAAGPRIVTREGFVHKAYNIQSPADYELHDIQTGALIEYLQPQSSQNFKIYVGTRVTVTGAEGIDPRWPRTPVMKVQSVDLMP
jgi:uncharacterized protein YgiM (DUF1202 family)